MLARIMIFLMYTDIFFIRNFSRALYNWMQCKVCMQLDLRTSSPRSYCIVSCSSSTKEKWYLLICTHACLIVIFCLLIVGEVVFSVWLHTFFNFSYCLRFFAIINIIVLLICWITCDFVFFLFLSCMIDF